MRNMKLNLLGEDLHQFAKDLICLPQPLEAVWIFSDSLAQEFNAVRKTLKVFLLFDGIFKNLLF